MKILPRKARSTLALAAFCASCRSDNTKRTPEDVVNLGCKHPRTTPLQVRSEILKFAEFVNEQKPKNVLEIGTNDGGTFFILCQLADPAGTIISLDFPGKRFSSVHRRFSQRLLLRGMRRRAQTTHFIQGDSHLPDSLLKVKEALSGSLDLLFIDGDHTYEGVRRDFEMYGPLVAPGGVIAFHDIAKHSAESGCEVHIFWNEIKEKYHSFEIVEDPSQGWAGIGVVRV